VAQHYRHVDLVSAPGGFQGGSGQDGDKDVALFKAFVDPGDNILTGHDRMRGEKTFQSGRTQIAGKSSAKLGVLPECVIKNFSSWDILAPMGQSTCLRASRSLDVHLPRRLDYQLGIETCGGRLATNTTALATSSDAGCAGGARRLRVAAALRGWRVHLAG